MEEKDILEYFDSLKTVYSFDFNLKEQQIKVITAILNKRNVFGLLPTGYGKSMCFVLPPLLLDEMDWTVKHISVVISPLKALMKDQVSQLSQYGVNAIAVDPEMPKEEFSEIPKGKYSVIFLSPEMALSKMWRIMFLRDDMSTKLCVFACDEAHCLSEWGEDFRPQYKDVFNLRSIIEAPVLAVTATCDEKVRTDIFSALELTDQDTLTVAVVPDRPNIFLDVRVSKQDYEKDLEWLLDYLSTAQKKSVKMIVYCRSVNMAATLYNHTKDFLLQKNIPVGIVDLFHRTVDKDSAERILQEFRSQDSEIRCLFATVAFGLGIQIEDIKVVVHWGVPKSLLSYWQEVGRAGRDGREAYAVCYAYGRSLTKKVTDEKMISFAKNVMQNNKCIRKEILNTMKIKDMDFIVKIKQHCLKNCEQGCSCDNCSCCSTCFKLCVCTGKYQTIHDRLEVLAQ